MEKYDVVIIGAGPAGTSAAKILESKRHNYLILDKMLFPRNKPCAGVLSPKVNSILKIPRNIRERPLYGYRVFSPSGNIVESPFPEPGSIVKRDIFDMFLVESLIKKPTHVDVTKIYKDDYGMVIVGNNWKCKAKSIIGADGANSIVKKYCKISSKKIAITAQYTISLPFNIINKFIGNWFEVYYTLRYGYGWISPNKQSLKIGVGILSNYLKMNIWDVLNNFMNHPIVKGKSKDGKIIGKETHIIPMSGPLDRLVGNKCILVGDAGGFVYPGTGEGIFYSIKTGQIAARVIDQAIIDDDYHNISIEKNYLKELDKNGILCLRNIDFVEKILSSSEKIEKYVKRLRYLNRN